MEYPVEASLCICHHRIRQSDHVFPCYPSSRLTTRLHHIQRQEDHVDSYHVVEEEFVCVMRELS